MCSSPSLGGIRSRSNLPKVTHSAICFAGFKTDYEMKEKGALCSPFYLSISFPVFPHADFSLAARVCFDAFPLTTAEALHPCICSQTTQPAALKTTDAKRQLAIELCWLTARNIIATVASAVPLTGQIPVSRNSTQNS